ncbi:hypothetical protein [Dyella sp. A6]|uniref:hypothetical protein n=1 Tax=Dyella aluminiiresistens TaxID=3069105 RepID=UPI002E7AA0ED|nr:hypothetical protein [Dyella sp. A6]
MIKKTIFALTLVSMGLSHVGEVSATGTVPPPDNRGLSLIIEYQTTPPNRPMLRQELTQSTVQTFAKWEHDGRLTHYKLLFSRYADSGNWDAMAILTFATPASLYRWRRVEARDPGALSTKALAAVTTIRTTPADLKFSAATAARLPDAVYVVIPYKTEVSASDYLKYANAYVIPQFKGWMGEGVLASYAIYMNQFPAGRAWNVIAILRYKDQAALSRREAVVDKVRARLKSNPEWEAISVSKQHVRAEEQVVVADPVVLGH